MKFIDEIRYRTYIDSPRERVFSAIATAAGWNAWFTTDCVLEPHAGGLFRPLWVDFGPDAITVEDQGRVLAIAEPERITFQWSPVGSEHPTEFGFVLEPLNDGTVVTLTDRGYPLENEHHQRRFLDCACGWGEALTLLKFYLEYGVVYRGPTSQP